MENTIQLYGFSFIESWEAVKKFLERDIGEGTVCSVEVGQYKNESRFYATVRFIDSKSAEIIKSLADRRHLWYGNSYLKARYLSTKLYQSQTNRPIKRGKKTISAEVFLCSMDDVTLHLGCQVSKEKFSVFWTIKNVCLKLEEGLRKLYFFLSHDSVDYKLELSHENIWQILSCIDHALKLQSFFSFRFTFKI